MATMTADEAIWHMTADIIAALDVPGASAEASFYWEREGFANDGDVDSTRRFDFAAPFAFGFIDDHSPNTLTSRVFQTSTLRVRYWSSGAFHPALALAITDHRAIKQELERAITSRNATLVATEAAHAGLQLTAIRIGPMAYEDLDEDASACEASCEIRIDYWYRP